ncbi:hypothetical protein ACHQM5_023436 [Ranunculus cassubicifolius]
MWEDQDMGPEFYKIVHPSLNTTKQLRIPPDFERHISHDESGTAVLRGPTNKIWKVRFSKTDEGTYLQDGWVDFLRDHSLGDFEVLIFRYDGDMCFRIEIFEKTAVKKEYTFDTEKRQEARISPVREEPQVLVEQFSPKKRVRGRPSKGTAVEKLRDRVPRRRPLTEEESSEVLIRAKSFKLSNPFFVRPLSKSSVYISYVLGIPAQFVRTHFPASTEVMLKNDEGKAWSVNLIRGAISNTFCGGWGSFVLDNQLEAGDVCVFELVSQREMHVHIFRCDIN